MRVGSRGPSDRDLYDEWLLAKIREIHEDSRGTYGAPRIQAELRAQGVRVGTERIARLMRTELVLDALDMAIYQRKPRGVVLHSDSEYVGAGFLRVA